ncbi:MAG: hypothetical protein H7Z43_12655 [Clostridia bacterium]|nr:hypothetical protein [Deltaproteobacteria bacterium]
MFTTLRQHSLEKGTPPISGAIRAEGWQQAALAENPLAEDGFTAVDQERFAARSARAPLRGPTAPAPRPIPRSTTPGARLARGQGTAQRLSGLAGQLAQELRGRKDRDAILRLTYQLMSSHEWTNADARLAYAVAAGAPNDPWKIIRDIRAAQGLTFTGNGFSRRDGLRASEYVFNDESTPYDGQISPAMRAVFAAIGFRDRGLGGLDAAFGTATSSLEDALWDIVNTNGVAHANAIIATRAGMPGGITSNLKSNDGPVDGHLEAPASGQSPLEHLIDAEYGNFATRAMQGFHSIDRDRMHAILRQPRGIDRIAFDKALQAYVARGEDFLKLFQNRTEAQNEIIAASYEATYGVSIVTRARAALTADEFRRFSILQLGTKSNSKVATAYGQASLPVVKLEERIRALRFTNALDVTSLEASGKSGSAIAAAVTKNLNARCAWLLREFDHEREPLRERLMQFEVTLGNVLTAVQERREREGRAVNLTDNEQVALGNAVRSLVGANIAFTNEREVLARTAQDTTILIATIVASTTLTVGSAGFGAPAGAALLATATNIGRVAAVGAAAGLITAPLQGGNHPYITSIARGGAFGAFTGLGASTGWMHSALGRIMPGTSVVATTARNVAIIGTTSGGLSGARNIGKTYDSPEEARAAMLRDVFQGALAGAGFAFTMGLALGLQQWVNAGLAANAAPIVTSGSVTQVATRLKNEATRLASRPITTADATEYYVRLARLSEMDAAVASMQQQGASAELLRATASKIAASRASLDTALAARIRDIFVQARTQATPAETAAVLQQFRGAFVAQGFADVAPRTMGELNAVARSLKL